MLGTVRHRAVTAGVILVVAAPLIGIGLERAGQEEGKPPEARAVLAEKTGYCHLATLDGTHILVAEGEWIVGPVRHIVHFQCEVTTEQLYTKAIDMENTDFRSRKRWHFEREFAFEAQAGRHYLIRDMLDSLQRSYVWIEDAETGDLAAGERPKVLEGVELIPDVELQAAIDDLGEGSTLVVLYTAPKTEVNRMQVIIRRKVVVDATGNEDFEKPITLAPGEYEVEVTVQTRGDFREFKQHIDVKLGEGRKRRLRIKASSWGLPSVRLG